MGLVAVLAIASTALAGLAATSAGGRIVSVIVREHPGAGNGPEELVERLGGQVGRHIRIINGFDALVPAGAVRGLRSFPAVHSVTLNAPIQLQGFLDGWDHEQDMGSMLSIAQEITGAAEYWNARWTGAGVGVALIDSGVVPVNGLTKYNKVVQGPDLSFESQAANLRYLDTFGHGTHMAGIIAGRDAGTPSPVVKGETDHFVGMAPDAKIISLKVADANGATDVSQVLAAIDWVVEHRNDYGMNIRVLNLSFGTDGVQSYLVDPLAYAAEVAWRKGIVVVVAAGNAGFGSAKLNNPAYDPFVIAVGASDSKGTHDVNDDVVASFSSAGDGARNPDLVAPGKSVVSLRAPSSFIDQTYPGARVGSSRFLRGSGTSQAAAVVSGAVALIMQQRPGITPDQVKALLTTTATPLPNASPTAQGAGELNLGLALETPTPEAAQSYTLATGVGSLEAARGSAHVEDEGVVLQGELGIFGDTWSGYTWSAGSWNGTTWSGGDWLGRTWTGSCLCTWTGNWRAWTGTEWAGNSWSGVSWTGRTWSSNTWSSNTWSAGEWNSGFLGGTWSSNTWSNSLWG